MLHVLSSFLRRLSSRHGARARKLPGTELGNGVVVGPSPRGCRMAEREVKGPGLDPVTERWVRDLLRGRDGDLSLRFHVAGGSVSMDVVPGGTTRRATGSSPRTAAFDVWLGGVLKARRMSQEAAARAVGVSLK